MNRKILRHFASCRLSGWKIMRCLWRWRMPMAAVHGGSGRMNWKDAIIRPLIKYAKQWLNRLLSGKCCSISSSVSGRVWSSMSMTKALILSVICRFMFPRTAWMSGPIRNFSSWMRIWCRRKFPVVRRMAFLPQDSCGAIRSLTGTRWQKMIMHGGLEESIISVIFMMYWESTISEASILILRFRMALRQPKTVTGSRGRAWNFSMRWKPRLVNNRLLPKI